MFLLFRKGYQTDTAITWKTDSAASLCRVTLLANRAAPRWPLDVMLKEEAQQHVTPLRRSAYYDMISSQIDAENQLSNMRVIWLLIAEAFFVGGYVTLLNAQKAKDDFFALQQDLLFWLLPCAAFLAAVLASAGVLASTKRVVQFQKFYERYEARTRASEHRRVPPSSK
jgi:hypothetical protein